MLTLLSIEVEGFGPFADRAVLTFPDTRGVTVVYGDNMRGKTSLMNAIRYAFFGQIQGRGGRTHGILSACNRDLVASGEFGFTVSLSLRYEGTDFQLVRQVTPRVSEPENDEDFTTRVFLRRGGDVLGPSERAVLLRAMLPQDVARFFLFDGELLDQYAELLVRESEAGRIISEAIEQILGVPTLRDARNHLASLASVASRASAKEASKHQRTQAMGNALQIANDMKEAHEKERHRKATELRGLLVERDEIETELRRQETYAVAVERLDKAREDAKTARNARETKELELKAAMTHAWRTVLDEPVSQAKFAAQQAADDVLASLLTSLQIDAIENHRCRTCGQDVPEDVRALLTASLPSTLTASKLEDYAGTIEFSLKSELDGFKSRDVRAEVRLIWEAIRQARLAEGRAQGRIADANKILEDQNPDELRRRKITLSELAGKIHAAQDAISAEQKHIEEQDAAIARLTKQLARAGSPELSAFQQRERVLARARNVFEDAVNRYKGALRNRVQDSATTLFRQMTTEKEDYASLAINDHYGLTIVHKDGRAEDSRSAGAEQIVAFALMGALQANAPLRGPIVMDTPFGRLDPQHTANVVTALPTMAEQVVIFVQEGEIDRATVRDLLGGHLLQEYQLDKQTARRTLVMEPR